MKRSTSNSSRAFLLPIWLFFGLSVFVANGPAYAQSSSGTAGPNPQCGVIADPVLRLACYDKASLPSRNPDAAQSAPWPEFSSGQLPRTRPQAVQALSGPTKNRKLDAGVTRFSFSRSGKFSVELDNGETWRQLESDNGFAQFKEHADNRVVISRGFWKSHDLKLNDMSAIFKVERVK
jgi:hypothetical protein